MGSEDHLKSEVLKSDKSIQEHIQNLVKTGEYKKLDQELSDWKQQDLHLVEDNAMYVIQNKETLGENFDKSTVEIQEADDGCSEEDEMGCVDDWSSDEENNENHPSEGPEVSPNDVNIYNVVPLEENKEEKVLGKTVVKKVEKKTMKNFPKENGKEEQKTILSFFKKGD